MGKHKNIDLYSFFFLKDLIQLLLPPSLAGRVFCRQLLSLFAFIANSPGLFFSHSVFLDPFKVRLFLFANIHSCQEEFFVRY